MKYVQQWPKLTIARNLLQVLNRYLQEFGMTPSSRSRIDLLQILEPDDDGTPSLEAFLSWRPAKQVG